MDRENQVGVTDNIPVVILCGGESLRFKSVDHDYHKALAPIGGKPILVHIIDRFKLFGLTEFIVCVRDSDNEIHAFFERTSNSSKGITIVRTGENTPTGGRLKHAEGLIGKREFFLCYGDCLNDVDVLYLLNQHRKKGVVATVTAVNPKSPSGIIDFEESGIAYRFREKPKLNHWINAGLFVFNTEVFNYLDNSSRLESDGLNRLIQNNQLFVYTHCGFWQSMDTLKEYQILKVIWESQKAPWVKPNFGG